MEHLSLIELKKIAKEKKIKQYYIMKRSTLIELLSMDELPFSFKLQKMTIHKMREIAKERNLRGFWSLSKEELASTLFPLHDEKKDNGETGKHQDPQNEDGKEVGEKTAENAIENGSDNVSL